MYSNINPEGIIILQFKNSKIPILLKDIRELNNLISNFGINRCFLS